MGIAIGPQYGTVSPGFVRSAAREAIRAGDDNLGDRTEDRYRPGRLGNPLPDESRPFHRPGAGQIAVKVINDYGDEVMKVFAV